MRITCSAIVSIIICTRNRADSLRLTLEALSRVEIPEDLQAELVLVDNASTDSTRQIVETANLENMSVRYAREERKGLSFARNRGLAEATGSIILFTDDDVRAPKNWIEGMCRSIAGNEADVVAGGVCFPPELDKLIPCLRIWFASTEGINIQDPERIVGANMAFGKHVLDKVPSFDVELGAGRLGAAEETLFCYQLKEAGFRIITRFDIAVEHHFEESRVARESMLRYGEGAGRSNAYVAYHWAHSDLDWTMLNELELRWGLAARRLFRWYQCFVLQRASYWESRRVEEISFRDQYRIERKSPRKYALRGLVKLEQMDQESTPSLAAEAPTIQTSCSNFTGSEPGQR